MIRFGQAFVTSQEHDATWNPMYGHLKNIRQHSCHVGQVGPGIFVAYHGIEDGRNNAMRICEYAFTYRLCTYQLALTIICV